MDRRILVPLDGSPFGEQALPCAVGAARRLGAALELVHVHDAARLDEQLADPGRDGEVRRRERAYLRRIAAELAERGGVAAATTLLIGPPAGALADHARQSGAAMVVMTTHGRGGVARAWLGSVADRLVRRLSMPILLVPVRDGPAAAEGEAPFHHLLVPLDGSREAERVLGPAAALAAPGARLTLIRVVPPELSVAGHTLAVDRDRRREIAARADAYLREAAGRLRERSFTVETAVLTRESPALAILEAAARRGAELIAMTTHGRGGLGRLVLGSVADKVLRGSPLPLLLQRPDGRPWT